MNRGMVLGIIRHLMTAIGGAIAARYAIDGAAIDAASGAILTLVGFCWSIYEKRK